MLYIIGKRFSALLKMTEIYMQLTGTILQILFSFSDLGLNNK
jgi:hypothetical protein